MRIIFLKVVTLLQITSNTKCYKSQTKLQIYYVHQLAHALNTKKSNNAQDGKQILTN